MRDLAKRSSRLWRSAQRPAFSTMSKSLFRDFGYDVSEETIRKAHRGEVDPTQCGVELLLALCAFYEAEPAELGAVAARRIETAQALTEAFSGPPSRPGGQGKPSTIWKTNVIEHPTSKRAAA